MPKCRSRPHLSAGVLTPGPTKFLSRRLSRESEKSMVTWWSPSLPNMSVTGQKLATLACRQTLIQSHFPVLCSTDMNCQLNSGGLGAHGSNPCTPTNKKARNSGLSSFLGMRRPGRKSRSDHETDHDARPRALGPGFMPNCGVLHPQVLKSIGFCEVWDDPRGFAPIEHFVTERLIVRGLRE